VFSGWPAADVPIAHITNGVHVPTWESRDADATWTRACGTDRWRGELDRMPPAIAGVSDDELWAMRTRNRERVVAEVREGLARRLSAAGVAADRIAQARAALDPAALTLGFARRFTGYKRPGLLLHDPDRLARLLTNRERPVQLVLAGKAHPRDEAGKAAIREWVRFADRNDVWDRVVFLSDYDLALAAILVRGADVWINTPRRPWEASGTSGMKVLVNGGLNLSELDGWWAEAYAPELGWAIRDEVGQGADRDAHEAMQLYARLEDDIVPRFYERNANGIPEAWVRMMRASMSQLVPRFSANRMIRQYVDDQYVRAAAAYAERVADGAERAAEQERDVRRLANAWHELRFVSRDVTPIEHGFRIESVISLGSLQPNDVRVELFADPGMRYAAERVAMNGARPTDAGFVYAAELPGRRPSGDYTARIVPNVTGLATPLECPLILWQR
jgi:starch phosphorylase